MFLPGDRILQGAYLYPEPALLCPGSQQVVSNMSGKSRFTGTILLLVLLLPLTMPLAGAQGSGSLTRGGTFTVTVIGVPRTAYDIWPKGTSFMTGEPGDQPPIIVAGQVDVVQDPPGGPYFIGSHTINGGGTILDDVPPASSVVPNTSYYAEVTTDASGHGVVLFQTSSATSLQQFHITAQNPADLGEDVQVILGVPPTPKPVLTPVMPLPLPTTMQTPLIPSTTAAEIPSPLQTTPTVTTLATQTAAPTEVPVQETSVAKIPLPDFITLAAGGIGFLLAGRKGG